MGMGWGAMIGLGQGLQNASSMIMDYNKGKMQEKLEIDRENRAEARLRAKEKREAQAYANTVPQRDENGVWWDVRMNKSGMEMDRTPASKHAATGYDRQERISEIQLATGELGLDKATFEVDNMEDKWDLDRRKGEASIQSSLASADSQRANAAYTRGGRGGSSGGKPRAPTSLSTTAKQSLFPKRDSNGEIVTNDKGEVVIDNDLVAEFLQSQDYQTSTDRDAAAATWLRNRRSGMRDSMRKGGVPEYAIEEVLAGRPGEVPTVEGLNDNARKIARELELRLQKAHRLIQSGELSPEEAAATFEANGSPKIAQQIRARYGIN